MARRCRVEYLHLAWSARLTFTVVVPGGDTVSAYQARKESEQWINVSGPVRLSDFAFLSAVDIGGVLTLADVLMFRDMLHEEDARANS